MATLSVDVLGLDMFMDLIKLFKAMTDDERIDEAVRKEYLDKVHEQIQKAEKEEL
jgi:hypothetical protein